MTQTPPIGNEDGSLIRGALPVLGAAALGLAFFFYYFDAWLLNPANVGWLMEGDSGQHFLGWHFYRSEPWHLPLGLGYRYGMEMGSSIVFSDSIPLLAMALKPFSAALPLRFQYTGLWMLGCYALQGAVAWIVARRLNANLVESLALTVLMIIAAPTLDRSLGHYALMAHWTLLLAFALYLRPPQQPGQWQWRSLLCMTALIHAYLLYLVTAVWVADTARRSPEDSRPSLFAQAKHAATTIALLLATMWLAGYFAIPVQSTIGGSYYGQYAANLLSLWVPQWPSRFVPAFRFVPGTELESDHYLGLGVILLLLVSVAAALVSGRAYAIVRRHRALGFITLGLAAVAASHRIMIADAVVATIPLPRYVREHLEFVRASARLIWLAYFGLIVLGIHVCRSSFPPRVATTIIVACAAIQLIEFAPQLERARAGYRALHASSRHWQTPLQSAFWKEAATRFSDVRFVPNAFGIPGFEPVALWAADNGLAINTGRFARVNAQRAGAAWDRDRRQVESGNLSATTLYVIRDPTFVGKVKVRTGDWIGVVDGYIVLTPEWRPSEE